jgi:hypothetical protein
MTRFATWCGCTTALLALSCAGHTTASSDAHTHADDACSNLAQPEVSAETSERLTRAANVIEYENTWKSAHPNATLGTVNRSEISSVIRSKTAEVQGCYESALGKLSDGRGRVVVRLVIDASGKVPNVSIAANDFDDPQVGCCLAKHIAQWALPVPTGGDFVVVEYPFVVSISHSR